MLIDKNTGLILTKFSKQNRIEFNDIHKYDSKKMRIKYSYDAPMIKLIFHPMYSSWLLMTEDIVEINKPNDCSCYEKIVLQNIVKNYSSFCDKLNKNIIYTFYLLHNKHKNIINYEMFGSNYENIILHDYEHNPLFTTFYPLNYREIAPQELHFVMSNYIDDELTFDFYKLITSTNQQIYTSKTIDIKGFIIYENDDEMYINTQIYDYLVSVKSRISNIYQLFLYFYQRDLLFDYLPYLSKYSADITKRINQSMRTLSKELLIIYNLTYTKNYTDLYECLPIIYKKILHNLHKLCDSSKKISVHSTYFYIKKMRHDDLVQLYVERLKMMENNFTYTFFDEKCPYTSMQAELMLSKL